MADAVLYRALADVQGAIVGAINAGTLVGLSTANVVIKKLATDRNQALPAVVISPTQEDLPAAGGLNDRDDITYNIAVALVNNDNQDEAANFEQELNWRQNVRRLFHNQKLGPRTNGKRFLPRAPTGDGRTGRLADQPVRLHARRPGGVPRDANTRVISMPQTENSLDASAARFCHMQAERRWEIYTGLYGTDHRPEETLEAAVRAHLARHGHPAGAPLPSGTATPWQDGRPAGPPRPLAVELASAREKDVERAAGFIPAVRGDAPA